MLQIDEEIEGEIQTIAFGGEGILRYRGFVVFVPFTAVGDYITCRVTEVKRSFAKGEIVQIQRPGKSRTSPPCPYFGTCGGCQLQHLTESAQLSYKREAVYDALKRIGHLTLPPLKLGPPSAPWAYRRHVTLHLRPTDTGFEAGYIARDNHSLVVVRTCPIFNTWEHPVLIQLQELVGQLSNPHQYKGRVTLLKNTHDQFILYFQFIENFTPDKAFLQKALQKFPLFAGILFQTPKESLSLGNLYAEQKLDKLTFRFTPQTFIQNNLEQSTQIYQQICNLAASEPQSRILDLYCGFGITSLLLAQQGHQVTGIEYNAEAIQLAQENRLLNRLKQVDFIQGDVEKIIPKWFKTNQANLIVLNPPRTGLTKGVLQALLESSAKTLIYVSCLPSTLARDLNVLCQKHYALTDCTVYDMFPQTAHVETLVYLKKKI